MATAVSGGVSLGAYEAGFQFYALEMARLNPNVFDLKLVAGASAGSLNSLLTILTYCGRAAGWPRESLFWKSWIPLGYERMFVPSDTTAVGMFSRRFGESVTRLYVDEWKRGASQECDIVLGVTTTRVIPRLINSVNGRLPLPRSEEKFAIRIRADGKGKPLYATNYVDPNYPAPQAMLPTNADGHIDFASIRDLIYASMSFPIAFAPQLVASCETIPGKPPRCLEKDAKIEPFIDGGVFDNVPLRMAARLIGGGLRDGGKLTWQPHPDFAQFKLPSNTRFLYLSPDAADYPLFDEEPAEIPRTLLTFVWQFANTFVSAARTKNLYSLIEEHPEMEQLIILPQRHFPAASGLLAAFFGFFETDFRIFDFYMGMYDARRSFEENRPKQSSAYAYPELVYAPGEDPAFPVGGWRAFLCMRANYDQLPELQKNCDGERLRAFRTLMQVSIERLYDNCARLGKEAATTNEHCKAALAGKAPPFFPGVETKDSPADAWKRRKGESELQHALRLLARHRFDFVDLHIGRDHERRALVEVRRLLGAALDTLIKAQPSRGRALIALVGEVAADYLAYSPPKHILYFVLGRQIELGYSVGEPNGGRARSSFRFNFGVLFDGLNRTLSSDRSYFGLGLAAGLEIQPVPISNAFVQPRLVLRAGYIFSANDQFLAKPCGVLPNEELMQCSRFVTQLQIGVTLLSRVRLQFLAEWYPAFRSNQKTLWSVTPEVGVQFPF